MRIYKIIIIISLLATSIQAQLSDSKIKELVDQKVDKWSTVLDLSPYKADALSQILVDNEKKMGLLFSNGSTHYERSLKELDDQKENKVQKLLTNRQYKLYEIFKQYEVMDQVDHLSELIDAYENNQLLAMDITNYQVNNMIPAIRWARLNLDDKISKADKILLDTLRKRMRHTLEECQVKCEGHEHLSGNSTEVLNGLLSAEITKQINKPGSAINQLFDLTRKYEENIHEEFSTISDQRKQWNKDIRRIQEKYIPPSQIDEFREIKQINAYVSLEHLKEEAFFLLMDPTSVGSIMNILRVGNHFLPYMGS
ncbi:hypothetical protein N9L92_02555 [Saprospiraceae bacterium]|nr:hypothetical protein [Saprospiraceae bacterium]